MKYVLISFLSASSGFLISGGVFTALIILGLVPRFAARTHTAKKIMLYENVIICACITGCILSVTLAQIPGTWIDWLRNLGFPVLFFQRLGIGCFGLFSGMFVGCVAFALAELIDTYSIFARRVQIKKGLTILVVSMAIGKTLGSLIFFYLSLGLHS